MTPQIPPMRSIKSLHKLGLVSKTHRVLAPKVLAQSRRHDPPLDTRRSREVCLARLAPVVSDDCTTRTGTKESAWWFVVAARTDVRRGRLEVVGCLCLGADASKLGIALAECTEKRCLPSLQRSLSTSSDRPGTVSFAKNQHHHPRAIIAALTSSRIVARVQVGLRMTGL
jgi:hypothetical protein